MSNIEQYRGSALSRSSARLTNKTLARIEGGTNVSIARVESRADVQAAQVDALAAVTQHGLQGVALFSQVEQQLAQAVPSATGRLRTIGDFGALAIGQVVMDTALKLRRI